MKVQNQKSSNYKDEIQKQYSTRGKTENELYYRGKTLLTFFLSRFGLISVNGEIQDQEGYLIDSPILLCKIRERINGHGSILATGKALKLQLQTKFLCFPCPT